MDERTKAQSSSHLLKATDASNPVFRETLNVLWFLLENTIVCRSPIIHFFLFINTREIIQRLALKLTNSLVGFFPPFTGQWWVAAGGFVPHHPSFHPKYRFPVSIRGAWLQGVELLKRELCVSLLEPRGTVSVIGPHAVAGTFQWVLCGK